MPENPQPEVTGTMDRVKDILIVINRHADEAKRLFSVIDEKLKELNLSALVVRNHDSTRLYRPQNCEPTKMAIALDSLLKNDLGLSQNDYTAGFD
jgi:hypothetical protein